MAEIPKALYAEPYKLIWNLNSRLFRYAQKRRLRQIFAAEFIKCGYIADGQVLYHLPDKRLLAVKQTYEPEALCFKADMHGYCLSEIADTYKNRVFRRVNAEYSRYFGL